MLPVLVHLAHRARWVLLTGWVAVLGCAAVMAAPLADRLSDGRWEVYGSPAQHVLEVESRGFLGRGVTTVTAVVHDTRQTRDDPAFTERVRRVLDGLPGEAQLRVSSRYGWSTLPASARDPFIGADGRTVVESVGLDLDEATARKVLPEVQRRLVDRHGPDGLDVSLVGEPSFWGAVSTRSAAGLVKAELLTMPLVMVILLLLFRSVAATLVSLMVAVTAVLTTSAILAVVAEQVTVSVFGQNMAVMLGLGLGVDYSLFMVSRFREQLTAGQDVASAVVTTLRTAGETVVISGATVAVAMATLFVVDLTVIRSMALGAVLVVAMSVLAAVVLLPVLLLVVGGRIHKRHLSLRWPRLRLQLGRAVVRHGAKRTIPGTLVPAPGAVVPNAAVTISRWAGYARALVRRPVVFLLAGVAVLVGLSLPALRLSTVTPDARSVTTATPVRDGYDHVQRQFGMGYPAALHLAVESTVSYRQRGDDQRIVAVVRRLAQLPYVQQVRSPLSVLSQANPQRPLAALDPVVFLRLPEPAQQTVNHFVSADRRSLVIEVISDSPAAADETRALVRSLRREAERLSFGGLQASIGGETAAGEESNDLLSDSLTGVLAAMLVSLFLLMLLTFRSLLLPLQAIVINVLSVGATYGVLVLLFQDGLAIDRLGVDSAGHIQSFVPILLLVLLFSLSTDYMVFLVNRVREFHRDGAPTELSIVAGVAVTGPLITGAAVLMVAVFGAFALASILPITQLGVGLAVAIIIDATIVRLVVTPAAMRLMGRWNWWLPRPRPAPGAASTEGVASAFRRAGYPDPPAPASHVTYCDRATYTGRHHRPRAMAR